MFSQDEADHKDDGDEGRDDLIDVAEQQFFKCIEAEKRRRETDHSRKRHEFGDEEKHDKGKVCSSHYYKRLLHLYHFIQLFSS